MTTTNTESKISWLEGEDDVDDNGNEVVQSWHSACGRFEIAPHYYDERGRPYGWELEDKQTGKSYKGEGARQLKRDVWQLVNYVPPPPLTREQRLLQARFQWVQARTDASRARTLRIALKDGITQ